MDMACKYASFLEGLKTIERPTNVRELARQLGISELTVAKYVAVLEAKGEIKTKILGRQRLIL